MKVEIAKGKSGENALRIDGDTLLMPTWNTKDGTVRSANAIVERIRLCLSFCESYNDEDIEAYGKLENVIYDGVIK